MTEQRTINTAGRLALQIGLDRLEAGGSVNAFRRVHPPGKTPAAPGSFSVEFTEADLEVARRLAIRHGVAVEDLVRMALELGVADLDAWPITARPAGERRRLWARAGLDVGEE